MQRWIVLGLVGLVGCATPDDGTYTGPVHRYEIDDFRIPQTRSQATGYGADLDGVLGADNLFGQLTAMLYGWGDLSTPHDVIASGLVRSVVEIKADSLDDDDSVAVWYFGADGDDVTPLRARAHDGEISSNRNVSSVQPGPVRLHLPIFIDADPTTLDVYGLEIQLESDHVGGFNGFIRGGLAQGDAFEATYLGISQMMTSNPGEHAGLRYLFDADRDGVISRDEIVLDPLMQTLFKPDLEIPGVGTVLSFGFGVHMRSCSPALPCRALPVGDTCHDRVRDRDETDLDCGGGSCIPCAEGRTCAVGSDCDSGTCAGTTCTAPSCSDGIANGFESDVDCGGLCPTRCTSGHRCAAAGDCASGTCVERTGLCK